VFDADRPILKSEQDKLNRSIFAKYLARCLLTQQDPESLVVGLYGASGVGKTSLINLILEEINFASNNMLDEEKPIILNFSPWSYSGQNQLIYSFFRRLSSTLRKVNYLNNADRIIHLLELYVSFFTHQPIPRSLRSKRTLWQRFTFQGHDDVYAWESGRDLTLVKAELNELLRQQQHKIVIIIDNISRLYPEEIRQIFQIVKSMGDYANTAYLLAFDKEQVSHALNKLEAKSAASLIEKVVQLPFDVPPILHEDIENIFSDRLNQILALIPKDSWNKEYWTDIYYTSVKYFFKNCRDITRYVNILQFSYLRLKDVVNPVDFFALTAIEIFLPAVYEGIRDNKDLFTDLLDNVYVLNDNLINKDKMRCDEIIARTINFPHLALRQLLMRLFPRLRQIYQPYVPFYHSNSVSRKLKRICSPDLFDAYFSLSMQSGYISNNEFKTILALAKDKMAFDQALARLNQDEKITRFLDQLDSLVVEEISTEESHAIISALLNNGDLFPPGNSDFLSLDTPMRIHRIIHNFLQKIENRDERLNILYDAISSANKSLFIIVHELIEQSCEHGEDEETFLPIEFRDFLPQQLASLKKLGLEKINEWASSGRLAEHPKLLPILYAWLEWDEEKNCQSYVRKMTNTDRGLIAFLLSVLETPVNEAMTKYEKNPYWENTIEVIKNFIDPELIKEHAKILFEDGYFEKLREKEQLALMIFLDLIRAKTEKNIPNTTA
jgi:predicted KAP-like P-loop ATPase